MERQTSNVMPVEPSETAPSAMEEEAYDSATSDAELVVEEYFSEEGDEEDDDDDYVPEAEGQGAGGDEDGSDDEEDDGDDDEDDDEDEDMEEDEEEVAEGLLAQGLRMASAASALRNFRRLPVEPSPLQHPLAFELDAQTSGLNLRHRIRWPLLETGAPPDTLDLDSCRRRREAARLTAMARAANEASRAAAPATHCQRALPEPAVAAGGKAEPADSCCGGGKAEPAGGGSGVALVGYTSRFVTRQHPSGTGSVAAADADAAAHAVPTPQGPDDSSEVRDGSWKQSPAAASLQTRPDLGSAPGGGGGSGGASTSGQQRGGAGSGAGGGSGGGPGWPVINTASMLLKRELGFGNRGVLGSGGGGGGGAGGFSRAEQRHLQCYRHLPLTPCALVDEMESRAYIGQFSRDGNFFVAAFQDRRVRLYDADRGWALRKDVQTRMSRWTITDTCLSSDQRFLLYASIIPIVYLVNVGSSHDVVESLANVTEIHEPLCFDRMVGVLGAAGGGSPGGSHSFGIWSVAWSGDGREVIAGANDQCFYIYDVERGGVVSRVEGHNDDINCVTYVDEGCSSLMVTASDDSLIKVWDRRLLGSGGGGQPRPAGLFIGHTEGLTHVDSKGDGRYIISNCKDQTIKLWDLRAMRTPRAAEALPPGAGRALPHFNWDYRWMSYPGAAYDIRHPHDQSLMTYRGHSVLQTLIRAYFSPVASTGQRFIYSGSADGDVVVWDVVTGRLLHRLKHHRALVRDCSWHPYDPSLTTVSWDGTVLRWDTGASGGRGRLPESGSGDVLNDWR